MPNPAESRELPPVEILGADDGFGTAETPKLPCASPIGGMVCPIGNAIDPCLLTPAWECAGSSESLLWSLPGAKGQLGQLGQIDAWAWEMGSELGSVPSAWSRAASGRTRQSSASRLSSASGHGGLVPGLLEGQRLHSVKPSIVSTRGGRLVVGLRKEVPQGCWDALAILLVSSRVSETFKPTGIKKGQKLCVEVPPGMTPDDYDVRLKFGEKILHGSIPVSIMDDDGEVGVAFDDDLQEATDRLRSLAH